MSAARSARRGTPKAVASKATAAAPPAPPAGDSFLSPSPASPEHHAPRSARDTPFSLKGIVIDVCRKNGFDPAEVMRPYPPREERTVSEADDAPASPAPGSHRVAEADERSGAGQGHLPEPRRPAPVDRSGAAAMARAVCSMDDDTFWIVYLALSVEYERRFGEAGLARKVAANRAPREGSVGTS